MKKKNIKTIYKTVAITSFIMLFIIGGVVLSLSILKDEAVDTNLKIADFHANTLAGQVSQTFHNLELLIKDLDNTLSVQEDRKLLKDKFTNIVANNLYIRSISLLDANKTIVYSSNEKNIGVELLSKDFYPKPMFNQKILRFGNPWVGRDFEDASDVTLLKENKRDSSSFLPILRKIDIDVVDSYILININSDYFISKYAKNLEDSFASLEIIRIDGRLLFSSSSNREIGIQVKNTALLDAAIEKNKSLGLEIINNKKYLTSYRLTELYPLNIAVELDFLKTMTKWEEKRVLIIYIITLLVLFSIALVFTLLYRYDKEKQHEIEFQKSLKRTHEKAKMIAEQANRTKSDFLANISHELRTPLNGVIGLTDLVLKSSLDEKQKDYLQKAQKSSNLLLFLINDILDYSKMEAQKLVLEQRSFKLDTLVQSLRDLFEYKTKDLGIVFDIEAPLGLTLRGDSPRLHQILTNIIGNAIKFTQEGFVNLSIRVEEEDKHSLSLYFSVKDSGIGMSEEVKRSLFNKFTQADSSITREYGGTGLGLAILKQLVELMGGKIWLESTLGVGSEFMFYVKFTKALQDTKKEESLELESSQTSHILLVEDNEINQIVAVGMLEDLGLSVDIASNGQEAVSKVKIHKYDLILMDLQMPILDGFEATKAIREFNKEIPIIALSAAIMKEKIEKNGMNGYLEKPINQEKFNETIVKYIGKTNIKRQNRVKNYKEEFYGVDMQELTARIGDKPEVIRQLLLNFCQEYAHVEDKFNIQESDSFSKSMHALKGISGNISLKSIYKLSKTIYESEDSIQIKELTPKLIELIKETRLELISQLEDNNIENELEIEYNKSEINVFIKDFISDLENSIVIIPQRVDVLLAILKQSLDNEEIKSIKNDLNQYRYSEANSKIKNFYKSL